MDSTQKIDGQCTALAEHLAARRTAILQAWRTAVGGDPQLATASSLPRAQFYDHIPRLARRIRAKAACMARSGDYLGGRKAKRGFVPRIGLVHWRPGFTLRRSHP